MKPRGLLVTLVAAVLTGAPAAAHHSFAVHFVADKLVTVHGKVDEFTFRNPHGVLLLTADGAGGAQQWKIETSSPNILRRSISCASCISTGGPILRRRHRIRARATRSAVGRLRRHRRSLHGMDTPPRRVRLPV